jgi:hypothetical protein
MNAGALQQYKANATQALDSDWFDVSSAKRFAM